MSRKKRLVVANWKMHPESLTGARKLFRAVARRVGRIATARVVICPPTLFLADLIQGYRGTALAFGAQDVSTFESVGSQTGEVSAGMLKRLGVSFVIVGHSERRALGETNAVVAHKMKAALIAGLTPILCIGEHERDTDGRYLHYLEQQLRESLEHVSRARAARIVVAYEPLWAIGKTAADAIDTDTLHQTALFIKKILVKRYGRKVAERIRILYGGSVEPSNDDMLMQTSEIDGLLVGHASLDADAFAEVAKSS